MRKVFSFVLTALLVTSFAAFAVAADGSWTGWIADEKCAANYEKSASAGHAGCAKACVKKGAKWALATKDGTYVLQVAPEEAEKHVGHEVTVKGELSKETKTIKVSSIS